MSRMTQSSRLQSRRFNIHQVWLLGQGVLESLLIILERYIFEHTSGITYDDIHIKKILISAKKRHIFSNFHEWFLRVLQMVGGWYPLGWFLFQWKSKLRLWHAPKLFHLGCWFQNSFCFFSRSFPSHVGKSHSSHSLPRKGTNSKNSKSPYIYLKLKK